jgi:hypothetical protein
VHGGNDPFLTTEQGSSLHAAWCFLRLFDLVSLVFLSDAMQHKPRVRLAADVAAGVCFYLVPIVIDRHSLVSVVHLPSAAGAYPASVHRYVFTGHLGFLNRSRRKSGTAPFSLRW